MTTQIRTILLTGLFFFGLLTGLQAQDKYDFSIIAYNPNNKSVSISINGIDFKKIDVNIKDLKDVIFDLNPLLKEVHTMNAEGWEVFDTGINGYTTFFYLKKKVG